MSGSLAAKVVRIEFEVGKTGRIYATSPDIRGLMIGRRSQEELLEALPEAIAAMYAACGVLVVVSRLEGEGGVENEWVAFPAEVARLALMSQKHDHHS